MGLFSGSNEYKSDIVLGEKYVDNQTGYVGIATSVTFFQHACERVCIETYDTIRKQVIESVFDAPRLTHAKTQKTAAVTKTGGPQMPNGQRGPVGR